MSSVITVNNLGKKYTISHQQREEYSALRDVITNGFVSLGKKLINPFCRPLASSLPTSSEENFWALQDISFEVKQGDRIGIIGRNGAGKSTLLKIISRITEPTTGSIRIRGRVASLLEVGTGFHPELTGRENIYLNGAILGMQRAEIRRKFDEIVDFAEIEKFLDTPVKRYSSGMYVRLAFAVAAHLEPEILIVDEVLAVGDSQFQKKCLGKMEDVGREGRTVLFVSHNMGAINSLCTSGIFLNSGKIEQMGGVFDVINEYLSLGFKSEASVTFPKDKSKVIQIINVTVFDHNKIPSTNLDMLKPFRVEIEYLVNQELSSVVIGCGILTSNGETLLATADFDLDRSKLDTRRMGLHKTHVYIPGYLLNSGRYQLAVGISYPGKEIYDSREVMALDLYDSGSFVVDGGAEVRRNAILLMGLKWDE